MTLAMNLNGLFRHAQDTQKVRVRAMMQSGEFVDELADVVQTQLLVEGAQASLRNRKTVPLYLHTEEGRPPVWEENLVVVTGAEPTPTTDTTYMNEEAANLHRGIKGRTVEMPGAGFMRNVSTAWVAVAGAVLVFFVLGWLAQTNINAPDARQIAAEEAGIGSDGAAGESTGPGGPESTEAVGKGAGVSSEQPVVSGESGGPGESDAPDPGVASERGP